MPSRITVAFCAVALSAFSVGGCAYDGIQQRDEQVRAARSELQIQLQRYADLVPNLLNAVSRHKSLQEDRIERVTEARADLLAGLRSGDLREMEAANVRLSSVVESLLQNPVDPTAVRGDLGFRIIRDQLEGTRQEIREAQNAYNEAVRAYNTYIQEFPQILTARVLRVQPRDYFRRLEAASDTGVLAE